MQRRRATDRERNPITHTVHWRQATGADAEMVWSWWTAPHVVYWSIPSRLQGGRGTAAVRQYLEHPPQPELRPLVGILSNGTPFAYAELYTVGYSPLARFDLVEAEAKGMHILIHDEGNPNRPSAVDIIAQIIDNEFETHPSTQHFVGDPDVRNTIVEHMAKKLGMVELEIVEFPHKTARFMAVSRDQWMKLRPTLLGATESRNSSEAPEERGAQ
jgi:hypothetical protein